MAPLFFLALRHWGQVWYFLLLIIGVLHCIISRPKISGRDLVSVMILVAPFLAVLVASTLRGELLLRSLDSPSRLLGAVPIYFLLRDSIDSGDLDIEKLVTAITSAAAIGLITTALLLDGSRTDFYGGRIATERVDTNALGAYVGIFLCLVLTGLWKTIRKLLHGAHRRTAYAFLALYLIGLAIGIHLLLETQSRGGWIGFLTGLAALLYLTTFDQRNARIATVSWVTPVLICTILLSQERHIERALSIPKEIHSWLTTTQQSTSGGVRLSMVQLSADLFFEKPLAGHGERGLSEQVLIDKYSSTYARQTLQDIAGAGPHNGILDQTLENGILGLTAALLLFLAPVLLVMRNLSSLTRSAAYENGLIPRIGLVYFLQLLALTFTSNPYGVRMFAALNALMLALLLAWCSRDVKVVST